MGPDIRGARAQVPNSASRTGDAKRPRLLVSTKNKSHDARSGVGLPVAKRVEPGKASVCAVVPRYVKQCGCHGLYTWRKGDPSSVTRKPLQCESWRHDGPCARRNAAIAFA